MGVLKTLFCIVACQLFAQEKGSIQNDGRPKLDCSIVGSVSGLSTGQPIPRAQVTLRDAQAKIYAATSNEAGSFRFDQLPPGLYTIKVDAKGFLSGFNSKAFRLAAGETRKDADIKLKRPAVLEGRVVDESREPYKHATVIAYRKSATAAGNIRLELVRSTTTDDRGEYRLFDLVPGKYLVAARPGTTLESNVANIKSEPQPVQTFYPGVELAAAVPVQAVDGQEVQGIDIRLRTVSGASVVGQMIGVNAETSAIRVQLMPRQSPSMGNIYDAVVQVRSRTFSFNAVAPGEYDLIGWISLREGIFTACSKILVGREPITGVQLQFNASFSLSGKVYEPSTGKPLQGVRVWLTPEDSRPLIFDTPHVVSNDKGEFTITPLFVGHWTVKIASISEHAGYLERVKIGNQTSEDGQVELFGPSSGIEVLIAKDGGVITGTIKETADPAAEVLVFRQQGANGLLVSRVPVADGKFFARGLRPGLYRVVAIPERAAAAVTTPEFLRGIEVHGVSVDVSRNGRTKAEIRMIPDNAVTELLGQL